MLHKNKRATVVKAGISFTSYTCVCLCVSAVAGLPGAFSSVCGEAEGDFCSTQESSNSRFGETQSSEGGRQDAAHLRQSHARRDRWARFLFLWDRSERSSCLICCAYIDWSDVLRERWLPGAGSRRDKFPSASRSCGGGGTDSAEDGQSDLRHPTGNDAGSWGTGDTTKINHKHEGTYLH